MTIDFFLSTLATVLAETSSSNNGGAIGLIFLLSGFVFYGSVFLKYRNTDKRHHYETETEATKLNLTSHDQLIESRKGLSNSHMTGANNTSVEGAGGLPSSLSELKGLSGQLGSLMTQVAAQATHTPGQPTSTVPDAPTPPAAPAAPPQAPPVAPPPAPPAPPSPPEQGPGQAF